MNDERVREHRVPQNTIVDRGGYIGPGGRINAELVRPPVAASPTTEIPPAVSPQSTGTENPPPTTY